MIKSGLVVFLLLIVSSCGSLRVSPRACKSDGLWGTPASFNGSEKEETFEQNYVVLTMDHEVRLKDFLAKKGIDCRDVKSLRVEIKSDFFIRRKLTVTVLK